MTLRLVKPPAQPTVSVRFMLSQHVDFVGQVDGGPETQEPVDPPRVIELTRDIDFRDMSGHAGTHGRAELRLTRDQGFRAGKWTLRVLVEDKPLGNDVDLELSGTNNKPRSAPRSDAGADSST